MDKCCRMEKYRMGRPVKNVIIESPYAGNKEINVKYAKQKLNF